MGGLVCCHDDASDVDDFEDISAYSRAEPRSRRADPRAYDPIRERFAPRPSQPRSRRKRYSSQESAQLDDSAHWGEQFGSRLSFPTPAGWTPKPLQSPGISERDGAWQNCRAASALPSLLPRPNHPSGRFPRTPDGKADFHGDWLCSAVEGDVEAFMTALDLGWATRSAAYLINYGVGVASRRICQNGDAMELQVSTGPAEFVQRFTVGSGRQVTEGPDGKSLVFPVWEAPSVLRFDQCGVDGSTPVVVRQYYSGEDLVVHMTAAGAACTAWIFQRQ
mmetsp:Transcript_52875/g.104329  ORF Transcript_52875/g.104329 Transcript_52875/m.104329 type:complete len:277 (-) Transcript_52875:45-875(-)